PHMHDAQTLDRLIKMYDQGQPIERHPRKGSSLLNRPLKQYLQTPFTNLNILFLALRLLLASIIEGGLKNLCKITHPVKSE
ncbi:hypothetical protein V4S57_22055, partial [Citrobacter freundii]